MASKPRNSRTHASGPADASAADERAARGQGGGPVHIHPVRQDPSRFAVVGRSGARLVDRHQAQMFAVENHPPKVVPIPGDPTHALYCEWSTADNQYICDIIDANDPRAG